MKVSLTRASIDALASRLVSMTVSEKNAGPSLGSLVKGLASLAGTPIRNTSPSDIAAAKALTTSSGGGQFLVPEVMQAELLPLLQITGVLRRAQAKFIPMANTAVATIPTETQSIEPNFINANSLITPADPDFGQARLEVRSLKSIFKVSDELAKSSVPVFDMVVKELAAKAVARGEDRMVFDSTMMNSPVASIFDIAGTTVVSSSGSLKYTDVTAAIGAALDLELPIERLAWFMNGQTFRKFSEIRDDSNLPVLKPHRDETGTVFTICGMPCFISPTVSNAYGSGTSSRVLLTDPQNIVVGDGDLQVSLSSNRWLEESAIGVRIIAPRSYALAHAAGVIILNVQ